MWPREIPNWVKEDDRRSAEIKVFEKLHDILDESWTVYYSRPWWGINLAGGETDGEADFIVGHPKHGLLFIEVKGGRISHDPESSSWHTTDRLGIRHRIKNPVEQAKTCRYRFFEKLKSDRNWPNHRVRMRYGVIFTDTISPADITFLGGYDPELFCHSTDFERNLLSWIMNRINRDSSDNEYGPGLNGLQVLQNLVAAPVNLNFTLQRDSESSINQMNALLTGAQLQILAEIGDEQSAIVEGGAGTGKTVIATELALRLIGRKRHIYFVAVGAALIVDVSSRLVGNSTIEVFEQEEFLRKIKNMNLTPEEVVIIDEAQDFTNVFWNELERIKLRSDFSLYVFLDSNQAVYRAPEDLATRLQAKQFTLRLNLRNTKQISHITSNLYKGPIMYTYGPEGSPPNIQIVTDLDEAISEVLKIILNLINRQGVELSSIAVLSKSSRTLERLKSGLFANRVLFSKADNHSTNSIILDTVSRFKGMESPFVILFADKELADHEELAYVAVSRARSHLFIVGNIEGTLLGLATLNLGGAGLNDGR